MLNTAEHGITIGGVKCHRCGETTGHTWKGIKVSGSYRDEKVYNLLQCKKCGTQEWYKEKKNRH
jgi:hypothetical protein